MGDNDPMAWPGAALAWLLARAGEYVQTAILAGDGRYYWGSLLGAVGVLALAYALRPDWRARFAGGFLRFCVPRGMLASQSSLTDIKLNLVNFALMPSINVAWRLSAPFFTAGVVAGLTWALGPPPVSREWGLGTIAVAVVARAILSDFGYFAWHYLAHTIPILWSFHKIHHSAEVLTPLVAGRVHPVEAILLPVFRNAAVALALGPGLYFFVGSAPIPMLLGMELISALFMLAGNQLLHAHVPISWGRSLNHIFVSPATHQIHHSIRREHWDRNMGGVLAIWDWMMGTLVLPDSRQEITYGVRAGIAQPHAGLVAAYLRPFQEILAEWRRPYRLIWRWKGMEEE